VSSFLASLSSVDAAPTSHSLVGAAPFSRTVSVPGISSCCASLHTEEVQQRRASADSTTATSFHGVALDGRDVNSTVSGTSQLSARIGGRTVANTCSPCFTAAVALIDPKASRSVKPHDMSTATAKRNPNRMTRFSRRSVPGPIPRPGPHRSLSGDRRKTIVCDVRPNFRNGSPRMSLQYFSRIASATASVFSGAFW